jgi:hypothetical protein
MQKHACYSHLLLVGSDLLAWTYTLGSACRSDRFFMRKAWKSNTTDSQAPSRWFARLWAAVLLACSFALPSAARAECGHYVLRGESGFSTYDLSSAATVAKSGPHEQYLPLRRGLPEQTCHGPHCSPGGPSPSLPITTIAPRAEHWGDIVAPPCVDDCLSTCRISEESSQLPRRFAQAVYHPPRFSSLRMSS